MTWRGVFLRQHVGAYHQRNRWFLWQSARAADKRVPVMPDKMHKVRGVCVDGKYADLEDPKFPRTRRAPITMRVERVEGQARQGRAVQGSFASRADRAHAGSTPRARVARARS